MPSIVQKEVSKNKGFVYSPQSIDSWKMAQTLNCKGEPCTKKYTALVVMLIGQLSSDLIRT